ncbi:MAG: hypothetical protein RMA76_04800 [Deltaproteobacteria bacterium]|jgi:hypothetical protein
MRIWFGLSLLVGSLLAPLVASAQDTDSASVQVDATVVAAMSVTEMNSPIDLGQLFQSSADDVAADGSSSPFSTAARFDITGASALSWRLTVVYADLTGPGAEVITITNPAANDICFNTTQGSQSPCTQTGDSPLTVTAGNHGGDGTAWVGFSFSVPANATAGAYSNAAAVQLTADALLGT